LEAVRIRPGWQFVSTPNAWFDSVESSRTGKEHRFNKLQAVQSPGLQVPEQFTLWQQTVSKARSLTLAGDGHAVDKSCRPCVVGFVAGLFGRRFRAFGRWALGFWASGFCMERAADHRHAIRPLSALS